MIGKKILNYEIKSLIGEGGMGNVYLAEHVQLGRKVAIKCLHAQLVRNENIRARFKNEAATLASLQHPGIVALYDYLEEPDGLYLVMEYVDGIALDDYIRNLSGPIPVEKAVLFMNQVLDAVGFAHSHGVVHRDLKPSNILLTKTGTIKILDFGIAKLLSDGNNKMTKTGTQMGTVFFMSPEQVHGAAVDQRTDIYALGVTLFQMLTGTSPYEGITTEFAVYNKIVSEPLPGVSSIYPGAPASMDAVIRTATAKNPADRYQDCNQFKYALQHPVQVQAPVHKAVVVQEIHTPPVVSSTGMQNQYSAPAPGKKKSRTGAYIVGGVMVLVLVVFVTYLVTRPDPVKEAQKITIEYLNFINRELDPGLNSMELEHLRLSSSDHICAQLKEGREMFDGNAEKMAKFNQLVESTVDSMENEFSKRIDAALFKQLQNGMWAKKGEEEYKNYLYGFTNDTMFMPNRKGTFIYSISNGQIYFKGESESRKITFQSLDEFTLGPGEGDSTSVFMTEVSYKRADPSDSLIGNWTASDYEFNYNYWTGEYEYNPLNFSLTFKPDGSVIDGGTPYKFSFQNGTMIWYYNSSGNEYKNWTGWYLKTKNTLIPTGSKVAALYRNRAKGPDSPTVMFE